MNILDARGRSCPEPVIMVKKATESNPNSLEVLLDTPVSVENVSRFAQSKGYKVDKSQEGSDFKLTLKK